MYTTQYTTVCTTYLGILSEPCLLQAVVQHYFQIENQHQTKATDSTKAKLGEPMSLLGFIEVTVVICQRARINDSKADASQKVPLSLSEVS